MKKVNIIIAPKDYQLCAMVPGHGLMLVDPPQNPGFKCWVENRTTIWEFGTTEEFALRNMKRRLPTEDMELGDVTVTNIPAM